MALIEIKELHLHVDVKSVDRKADKIIVELLNLQNIMAKTKEEIKAEFAAQFGEMKSSLANLSADLDRVIDNTSPQGGLTEEEVEEQLTELRGISAALKSASEKVPEPPSPDA